MCFQNILVKLKSTGLATLQMDNGYKDVNVKII